MKELAPMFDPPRPGEFICEVYLAPSGLSARALAGKLGVTPSTLQRLLGGLHGVSPEMALRLSVVLGRSAESWPSMQGTYDLWQARKTFDSESLEPLAISHT